MNKKNVPFIIGAVVILLGLVGFVVISGKKSSNTTATQNQLPTSAIVPTVDSSVKVDLQKGKEKGYVELTVDGIPSGTKTLEYELTYDTTESGLQGIPSSPVDIKGENSIKREFFLGTQSSGAKTYHTVKGPITLQILFTGSYGQKSFQKDFKL